MTSVLSRGQVQVCHGLFYLNWEGLVGVFTWNLTEVRHTNRKWFSDFMYFNMVSSK